MSANSDSQTLVRNLPEPNALSALVRRAAQNRAVRFTGHFLEMVLAMFPGMFVFHTANALLPAGTALTAASPLYHALMGISMAVPMIAWMKFRRHNLRQCFEMTAAMLVPMGLLVAVSLPEFSCLAMSAGMLGLMLYRRNEYSHGEGHHHTSSPAVSTNL